MPGNYYFNNYSASNEQGLLDDLISESINIHGEEVYYLPRTLLNKDQIYGQADMVSYNGAYLVPMYIDNVDGFSGPGNIMSRFGLEIRSQVTFTVSMKTFADEVAANEPNINLTRPREGDLIWFPLSFKPFQILFVDKFSMIYPLGSLHVWKMTCELFEYSSETFHTGVPEIDGSLQPRFSADLLQWAVRDENGDYITTEDNNIWVTESYGLRPGTGGIGDANAFIGKANTIVDWSVQDPFGDLPGRPPNA